MLALNFVYSRIRKICVSISPTPHSETPLAKGNEIAGSFFAYLNWNNSICGASTA